MIFVRLSEYYTAMFVLVTSLFGLGISEAKALTCGPRQEVKKQIVEFFHEKPVAMGIVSENVFMHIYVSELGTWTISLANTEGNSCIVAAGSKFQFHYKYLGPEA
ncbi:MAG: hypothetical protein ACR2PH_09550 [Desulfobulbia bacterium]